MLLYASNGRLEGWGSLVVGGPVELLKWRSASSLEAAPMWVSPTHMYIPHVYALFPCSMLYRMSYCLSMLYVFAVFPCCMSLLHVLSVCLSCMSLLHFLVAYPCFSSGSFSDMIEKSGGSEQKFLKKLAEGLAKVLAKVSGLAITELRKTKRSATSAY
jgi:hypothetical protein